MNVSVLFSNLVNVGEKLLVFGNACVFREI